MNRKELVGWLMLALGGLMVISIPFTPKFILEWYNETSFRGAIAHTYLIIMFFGGLLLMINSLIYGLPLEKEGEIK